MKRARVLFPPALILVVAMAWAAGAARAEGFFDVYVGAALPADTKLGFTAGAGFVDNVTWENTFIPGGRVGYWLGGLPYLGFALDVSYFEAKQKVPPVKTSVLQLNTMPLSALLMARYPLLVSNTFPEGQVYPYIAAGPAAFLTEMTGELVEGGFARDFDDSNAAPGLDLRVGGKLFHPNKSWGFFAEYRFTYFDPPTYRDDVNGVRVVVETESIRTHYMIFGVGYHF